MLPTFNINGPEWQDYVLNLLRLRYSVGALSVVPDTDRGDYGIEAFATDECAFQCYAPEEPLTTKQRYEKHRNKMTEDLAKFCRNQTGLLAILGPVRISTWVFVVPRHDSKDILAHAATKTAEIREKKLPHATAGFRVTVCTADDFPRERDTLAQTALHKHTVQIDDQDVQNKALDWAAGNDPLVKTLDKKVERLVDAPVRQKSRDWLLGRFVASENVLAETRRQFPLLYERFMTVKRARERELAGLELGGPLNPNDKFEKVHEEFTVTLEKEIKSLDSTTLNVLRDGTIADWMLRCPLQFEEDDDAEQ